MDLSILMGGIIGAVVSVLAIYVFYELSVAYWAPDRAGNRWTALIDLPKLQYFRPVFRWLMPLFALFMLLQLFIALQLVLRGLGVD